LKTATSHLLFHSLAATKLELLLPSAHSKHSWWINYHINWYVPYQQVDGGELLQILHALALPQKL